MYLISGEQDRIIRSVLAFQVEAATEEDALAQVVSDPAAFEVDVLEAEEVVDIVSSVENLSIENSWEEDENE
jgi:hypothetical protein